MNETYTPPEKIQYWNVCYWAENQGMLLGSRKIKAKNFLQEGCIQKINETEFRCKPIEGYNKTTHKIIRGNGWKCTCQFNQKVGKECSHILACKLFNFMEEWNK